MEFLTRDDLTIRRGEEWFVTAVDSDSTGQVPPDKVTTAISDVNGQISACVGQVYDLEILEALAEVPAPLTRYAVDMVAYCLCPNAESMTKETQKRYDEAMAYLTRLKDGDETLDLPPGTPDAQLGLSETEFLGDELEFSREKWGLYG